MKIRVALPNDAPDLFRVRTSVRENHQSEAELATLGVTPKTVAEDLASGAAGGWCAEVDGEVVGFSMARAAERDVFALFVDPRFEGRGIGTALLTAAVVWLRGLAEAPIQLSTGRASRAFGFYLRRGWREVGVDDDGDPLLELGDRGALKPFTGREGAPMAQTGGDTAPAARSEES